MIAPTADQGWSAWPAPAKLNLFLRILGRRSDGYHRLQTVFRLLDWGDRVHLRPRDDGQIVRVVSEPYGVPAGEDLVVRAAEILRKSVKIDKGADIFVEKHIPIGGGFGGGSSDAATVLVALNRLWGAGASETELAELGLQLGADVPVFVRGHNAWAEGIGERLTPIELAPAWYLLIDSGVSVPTQELFQAPELTRDAAPATMVDFVSGAALGNAFEPVLRGRQPAVDTALRALSKVGQACLTGTGGGCFAAFMRREDAVDALHRLPRDVRAWVAAGAQRSPLLDALEHARTN